MTVCGIIFKLQFAALVLTRIPEALTSRVVNFVLLPGYVPSKTCEFPEAGLG